VRTNTEGYDSQRDVWHLRRLYEAVQLHAHHLWAANHAMQHGFVEERYDLG
jgi:hypothetical protein